MKIRDRILELRRVPARELLPNPKNWRTHPAAQQSALQALLAELGYCTALIARVLPDGRLQLIDGHLRRDITPDTVVPVLVLDVTEAEADKLLATLDPVGSLAEADVEALQKLLASVTADSPDIQVLLADLAAGDVTPFPEIGPIAGLVDPDQIPEPPDEPVTQLGDSWILGPHRLRCGDSTQQNDVDRLLDGAPIHLVVTDAPYGVGVQSRSRQGLAAAGHGSRSKNSRPANGKLRPKDRPLLNDFLSEEAFEEFVLGYCRNIARVLLPGRSFFLWGGYSNLDNYLRILKACELYFSQLIVWDKQHPVLTRKDFMGCFELAFYGWKPGCAHQFFGAHSALDLWTVKKISPQQMIHLTEKPVELSRRAIQYSSRRGENVLDLFGGSGSTLIAAEQTGRRAFLMELDRLYVDVIVERWQTFTGRRGELCRA